MYDPISLTRTAANRHADTCTSCHRRVWLDDEARAAGDAPGYVECRECFETATPPYAYESY